LHRFDTDLKYDKRTDGRTDTLTMAKTREALHAVARKNNFALKIAAKPLQIATWLL